MKINIAKLISRKLGYGAIEYPYSNIMDMPVKIVDRIPQNLVRIKEYPRGVQIIRDEIGHDGKYRIIFDYRAHTIRNTGINIMQMGEYHLAEEILDSVRGVLEKHNLRLP